MTNVALDFAFANEEEAFAVIESVGGTLLQPSANDRIYTVGPVDFGQDWELKEDEQVRASPSRFSAIKARLTPGEWSCNTYVKPSGTVGTAPEHDVLFQGLMGGSYGLDSGNYKYKLSSQLDAFSLWTRKGHTVFAKRGVTVEQAEFGIMGEDIGKVSWSGKYMQQYRAGTGTAHGTISSTDVTIQLKAGHSQRFSIGCYVNIGDSENHLVSAINYTNDTLTIPAPGVDGDQGSDPAITPWWPTAGTEIGTPVHGKMGMVTIEGQDSIIMSARVTVVNNIKYYEDEKNNLWTAERFGRPKFRDVDGELELRLLRGGATYWYRAEYQIQNALVIPVGNVSGYTMELIIPYAEYRSPKITGEEEFNQTVPFVAVASEAMNDEIEIRFT